MLITQQTQDLVFLLIRAMVIQIKLEFNYQQIKIISRYLLETKVTIQYTVYTTIKDQIHGHKMESLPLTTTIVLVLLVVQLLILVLSQLIILLFTHTIVEIIITTTTTTTITITITITIITIIIITTIITIITIIIAVIMGIIQATKIKTVLAAATMAMEIIIIMETKIILQLEQKHCSSYIQDFMLEFL